MKIDFAELKKQYLSYQHEIDAAIHRVLDSTQFILGPDVAELENQLAEYTGARYAIGCASGTDALQLALMAIDIQPGDEVITTPFTFIATAEMIVLLGARPVFVDIEPDTFNIDVTKIAEKITSKTKAILPVSLYGQPADMNEINQLAEKYAEKLGHKIYVIEDAAQSFGAEYQNKKSCHLSELACTSFFPSKPLGCYGDGGALFTSNATLVDKIQAIKVHGQTKRYYHEYVGFNARLDTLQAAILLVKLKHFPEEVIKRQRIAEEYTRCFAEMGLSVPMIRSDRTSVYAQYTLRVKNRDAIQQSLQNQGIPTAVHYPKPLHLQPCFKAFNGKVGDFPHAELAAREVLSLPMNAFVTAEAQAYIITQIKKCADVSLVI